MLGAYRFEGYRKDSGKSRASSVLLHAELDDAALSRSIAVGEAVALVKDLVFVPAEWQSPTQLAQSAADSVSGLADVTVEILDEDALAEQGFGGILGVGQGSTGLRASSASTMRPRRRHATSPSSARASHSTPADSRSSRQPRWSG